jgi:DNA-binding winged helix-turn-helix (wHTH) protein
LLADGQPVKLSSRAFDVLTALIERRDAVVDKDALMARVWPDMVVDESSLQLQVSALRKALGADRRLIRTVFGRGYQFVGEIQTLPTSKDYVNAAAPSEGKMEGRESPGHSMRAEQVDRAIRPHQNKDSESGDSSQQQLVRAAEEFRAATDQLLDVADRALAELRDGREITRTLLDQLEARLPADG